jgi:hypothetical protein
MAHPLSFKFLVHADAHHQAAAALAKAFSGDSGGDHPLPPTVHYLWLLALPDQVGQPPNTKTMLLTTVYDGPFAQYVDDIATAHQQLFDAALQKIVGMEKMVPVIDHLPAFAAFIQAHDMAQSSSLALPFVQNYPDTVQEIWANGG